MGTLTATALRKLVCGPAKDGQLWVAEHDGGHYVTNRYFIAPVSRIAPLLTYYNLPTDAPGTYTVNGSVRRDGDQAPAVGAFLDTATYSVPVTPTLVSGRQALVEHQVLLRVYEVDGEVFGIRADLAAWLFDDVAAYGDYGVRFANPQLRGKGRNGAVALVAEPTERRDGHFAGEGAERTWVQETWEPAGDAVVLALVMPVRLSG